MTPLGGVPFVGDDLIAGNPPALQGGCCGACGSWAFPAVDACGACGAGDVRVTALSTEGAIYSFTIIRIPVPGYHGPVPYGLGIVELEREGLRVGTTLLADPINELRIGAPVRFRLFDVGTEDEPLTTYAYEVEAR